jgi:hypothetical protein
MREVGVLVLVFVPLEVLIRTATPTVPRYPIWTGGCLDWLTEQLLASIFFTIAAILMLYLGIKIETKATVELDGMKGGNHDDTIDRSV